MKTELLLKSGRYPYPTSFKVIVPLFFLALYVTAPLSFYAFGFFHLSSEDVVLSLVLAVLCLNHRALSLRFDRKFWVAGTLALLFLFWFGISATFSPIPSRGLTLFLIMLRDVLIFVITANLLDSSKYRSLGNSIVAVSSLCVLVGLSFYLPIYNNRVLIEAAGGYAQPKYLYEVGSDHLMRFEGFSSDPNFLGVYISISLLILLWDISRRNFALQVPVLAILTCGLWLTFSRSALVGMILVIPMSVLLLGKTITKDIVIAYLKKLLGFGCVITLLGLAYLLRSHSVPSMLGAVMGRLSLNTIAEDYRWKLTRALLDSQWPSYFMGNGLRSVQVRLGGQYGHNSWLEILIENGIVGVLLFFLFVGWVSAVAISGARKNARMLPWLQAWLLVVGTTFFFSFHCHFLVWLVAGVIVGLSNKPSPLNQGA